MAEHTEPASQTSGRGLALRRGEIAGLLIVLIAAAAISYALASSSSPAKGIYGSAIATHVRGYEGLAEAKAVPAPSLKLDNYLGRPVNLRSFRGKAVLVTFIYTHCPDTCPLMVSHLHTALALMTPSERAALQIIAVSVDPRGDTPKTVAAFLHNHLMTGRMQFLIGSRAQLQSTWSTWGISAGSQSATPDVVEHTALIYGITDKGKVAVVYPSNFTPGEIAHDARLLAAA
ncbi:MAG TPA: SCO family protein [Solirubrobacteraceae bacterium]|jgi:protein SCO1/2